MAAAPDESSAGIVLRAATPQAWFEAAAADWQTLLVDHANCEKKAASTALALMFTYSDDAPLCRQLSRLAREELRHYEQVERLMQTISHNIADGVAHARGTQAALFATHDRRLVTNFADRVLVLAEGRLAADVSAAEFYANERLQTLAGWCVPSDRSSS